MCGFGVEEAGDAADGEGSVGGRYFGGWVEVEDVAGGGRRGADWVGGDEGLRGCEEVGVYLVAQLPGKAKEGCGHAVLGWR